jgi:hypothetical protein
VQGVQVFRFSGRFAGGCGAGRALRALLPGAALVLFVTSGCEGDGYPTVPGPRALVVHGMLGAGTSEQEILLEHTRYVHEGFFRDLTPVSGARVTVSGTAPHAFREDPLQPGVYRASFVPAAGERYVLQIEGPDGERVRGETLVPQAPRLISPGADTAVALGSFVTVLWSSSPAAAAYVITDSPAGEAGNLGALLHPAVLADTSFTTQPGMFGRTAFHMRVTAVDSNYVRHRPGGSEDSRRIRQTVDGAYGLFGSYASSGVRTITIR